MMIKPLRAAESKKAVGRFHWTFDNNYKKCRPISTKQKIIQLLMVMKALGAAESSKIPEILIEWTFKLS